MTISKKQLAAALLSTLHVDERERFSAFITDDATRFAPNPFAVTTVGVVVQTWSTRRFEFSAFAIVQAGLDGLLNCARARCPTDTLLQEILKAGSHTLYLFHEGDGCGILGGVLHGKPGSALPCFTPHNRRQRKPSPHRNAQLDLFTTVGAE